MAGILTRKFTISTLFINKEKADLVKSQDISNTRKHMQTPRLNIVLQRINVEDGARICAPNFKIFPQSIEMVRQTKNKNKGSKSMKAVSFNNL